MYKKGLNRYYETVSDVNRDGDLIQIPGPGEAKGEFEKHHDRKPLHKDALVMETIDRMNDRQIALKVLEFLRRW